MSDLEQRRNSRVCVCVCVCVYVCFDYMMEFE